MPWIVRCPAKLNLFLAVGKKDGRGYHPLRTVFQAIDLADLLELDISDKNEFICDNPEVPANNTVTKTLRLLGEVVNLPPLRIRLVKHIPSQSGLGGGSSDAAGLIRAAEAISGQQFPKGEMFGLAQTIGADVPFFLVGGKAKAEGYGERLEAVPDPTESWLVVAKPSVSCDTAQAYARLDDIDYEWRTFSEQDELYNDFERVAPCESLELIERLQVHGARDAALSGSGSAVFGRFEARSEAELAAERLRTESPANIIVARTLTRAESLHIDHLE